MLACRWRYFEGPFLPRCAEGPLDWIVSDFTAVAGSVFLSDHVKHKTGEQKMGYTLE